MGQHEDFILTPLSSVVDDAVSALQPLPPSISQVALCEYVMHSLFLKMTGFQEQKCKCICWDMATFDYEYRYDRFTRNTLGECSNLTEKDKVFTDIHERILNIDSSFNIYNFFRVFILPNIPRIWQIVEDARNKIMSFYSSVSMLINLQADYFVFQQWVKNFKGECLINISNKNNLIFIGDCNQCDKCIKKNKSNNCSLFYLCNFQNAYKGMYNHRNRCAHNTLSYQIGAKTLLQYQTNSLPYDNYFARFFVLLVVDGLFVALYKEYLRLNTNK